MALVAERPTTLRKWLIASPWRLLPILLIGTVVLLVVVFLRTNARLRQDLTQNEMEQNVESSRLAAVFLREHFRQSTALLMATAGDHHFQDDWKKKSLPEIRRHMEMIRKLEPNFALASVYDTDGTMIAIAPHNAEVVGANFAYRDWYKGVAREWKPYVSEVYRTRANHLLSVAVAVPVVDEHGKPIGIIAAAYALQEVRGWLGDVKAPRPGILQVVDQNGMLLARPGIDINADPVDMKSFPPVLRVQHGESGVGMFWKDGQQFMVAYRPIPEMHWGVLSVEPVAELENQLSAAKYQQWISSGVVVLLALIFGVLFGLLLESQIELKGQVELLQGSEQQYRSLIQSAVMGMYRSDAYHFLVANPALVAMLGYHSEEELAATRMDDIYYDPTERKRLIVKIKEYKTVEGVETIWKRRDGSPIHVRISGRFLRDEQGEPLCFDGIVEDVTVRKGLEEQLRTSEKQAAIGRMVAGAAHEINNPLTAVMGYLEMLSTAESVEQRRDLVEKARAQSRRVRNIVSNLLSFAKQRKAEKQLLDLNRIVDNAMRLQDLNVAPGRISFRTNFDFALPPIWGDEYQILQVCLHVLNNAADAVRSDGGGIITANTRVDGEFVVLEIDDNGHGIAEPEHVFDPFYTTKEIGAGTGLGLSASYGIVHEHGGEIMAMNLAEGGARIRMRIPAAEGPAIPLDQGSAQAAQ